MASLSMGLECEYPREEWAFYRPTLTTQNKPNRADSERNAGQTKGREREYSADRQIQHNRRDNETGNFCMKVRIERVQKPGALGRQLVHCRQILPHSI